MSYQPEMYIHELDKRAYDALNKFPKLLKLKEAYLTASDEKQRKYEFLSSAIRLSEKQMPQIYSLLPPICEKLGIDVPELYYIKSGEMNAATCGSTNPYIFVTSALVDKMPTQLISSVLAHECGHIACRHWLFHTIAMQLVKGVNNSPFPDNPAIGRYLSPSLVNALLFWFRCSELSADRAAVLCDGGADNTVDMLLRINGYGNNIDRDEFVRQALDLKDFVTDSHSNRLIEQMIIHEESHPRMATRVYECCEFAKSERFSQIINGTFTLEKAQKEEKSDNADQELIAAEIESSADHSAKNDIDIDAELARVNSELERFTNHADKTDYAFAVCSGILSGVIDSLYVGEFTVTNRDIGLSHEQVNRFIQSYAKARGIDKARLKDSIAGLEEAFKVAQDNTWNGAGISVSATNHHLADLAHHPTPLGLLSAIIVRFLRVGTFVSRDGKWHFELVKTSKKELAEILIPVVLTGTLNWLVTLAENKYEDESGNEVPKALHRLAHIAASAPILIEIAKCADNWLGHLVSDMGGSKSTAGGGMGIPGIMLSLLYEVAALPGLKDTGLPKYLNDLYTKQKFDLRHEIPIYKNIAKQAVPVIFNELLVRLGYFVIHLALEFETHHGFKGIDWGKVIPLNNRTVDRMMTVASMTFTVADTADAAVHAALESAGDWVLFSGKFVTRFNYIGAGRAAIAVVKEISNEKKEAELIHEKLLLTEAKTKQVIAAVEEYKAKLEEKVSDYLAEDIEAFLTGFDQMHQGLHAGDSDLVIHGNVTIQRVLGREPQFTNQEEFDALMASETPITF